MKPDDGTCRHYGQVEYEHWTCMKCSMNYLRCPICKPSYCPDCRVTKIIVIPEMPYYKAKLKQLAYKKRTTYLRK